jgi:hypothetical protein
MGERDLPIRLLRGNYPDPHPLAYRFAAALRYNNNVKRSLFALAAIALALLPLAEAAALEAPVAIRPTWGVLVESLLDHSADSAIPSPSIEFNFGSGVVMPFQPNSPFTFEPSADFYYFNGEFYHERAVPSGETFGSTFVLGLLLDAPIFFTQPLGPKLAFGVGAGICLDLRVAFTNDPGRAADTPAINRYFWDKGRFATPSTLIRGEYNLTDRLGFGFTGRVLWPIYNLWSGEGYGFFDQGMYLIDLSILYKLNAGS